MYGLGIRIGYYVQWVATVLGAYYTPKVVSSAFEANAIFNIGMLAGLVYSTIARDDMYVVEPMLVLGFSIGGAIVGLLDPKNVHDPKSLKSLRARLVHLCGTGALSLPLLVYWTWYSFYGMDTLTYNRCATYTFFITKIDIWVPWFRYFMKVATIMSLVGLFSLAIGVIVAYRTKSQELPAQRNRNNFDRPRLSRSATALAIRSRPTRLQFFIVIIICAICALSVELGIVWNNISAVNSLGATGQLIPLAIGIITSVRVLLGIIGEHFKSRKQRRKEAAEESFFGGGGEMIDVRPSRSLRGNSSYSVASRSGEGDNDEVLDLSTLVKPKGIEGDGLHKSSTSVALAGDVNEKGPSRFKITHTNTGYSGDTITEFTPDKNRPISVKSGKACSLRKPKPEKLKEKERLKAEKEREREKEKDRGRETGISNKQRGSDGSDESGSPSGSGSAGSPALSSSSSMVLPREPAAALTRSGETGSSVTVVNGLAMGRKKLQKDPGSRGK